VSRSPAIGEGEQKLIPQQIALSAKLDEDHRRGKLLTIATGIVIPSVYPWVA
jgi:hypothetical protein